VRPPPAPPRAPATSHPVHLMRAAGWQRVDAAHNQCCGPQSSATRSREWRSKSRASTGMQRGRLNKVPQVEGPRHPGRPARQLQNLQLSWPLLSKKEGTSALEEQEAGAGVTLKSSIPAWRVRARSSRASLSMPMCSALRRPCSSSTVSALGFTDACARSAPPKHPHASAFKNLISTRPADARPQSATLEKQPHAATGSGPCRPSPTDAALARPSTHRGARPIEVSDSTPIRQQRHSDCF
jgi:hypothetical protein